MNDEVPVVVPPNRPPISTPKATGTAMSIARRLAYEAADCDLLSADLTGLSFGVSGEAFRNPPFRFLPLL
jgi:hypothetical protein